SRMKTILQNTSRTLKASTSGETGESDRAALTYNVRLSVHMSHETYRAASGQINQVERLFPEFFTSSSNITYKVKTCENGRGKVEQRPDDPLIQSWLNLYGGGSRD
ncbi:hypothetical protein ACROYT_G013336, partial [Oculina patagonica]